MRKIAAFALTLFLIIGLIPVRAEATSAFLSGSQTVQSGRDITLMLWVSGSNIMGVETRLSYDEDLMEYCGYAQRINGWEIEENGSKFIMQGSHDPINTTASIMSMTFRVKSDAAAGTPLTVCLKNVVVSDGKYDLSVGTVTWTGTVVTSDSAQPGVSEGIRIYGSTRYETAIKAADELKRNMGVEKFDAVVVACGTDFADALSGSYLACQKGAPILLVRNNPESMSKVKEYIRGNVISGGSVYLLGGIAAIPATMETGLDGFAVKRLAGDNRYATNLAILHEAGIAGKDILICTGKGFADGLSVSAANLPVLLVKDSLSAEQKALLSSINGKIYIIGGTNAVSAKVESELKSYGNTERISGATRYETSVNIAKKFFPSASTAILAYGANFPDGLSGGPLAANLNAPLILTVPNKQVVAVNYATQQGISGGYVLGGTGLISDSVVRSIFGLAGNAKISVR